MGIARAPVVEVVVGVDESAELHSVGQPSGCYETTYHMKYRLQKIGKGTGLSPWRFMEGTKVVQQSDGSWASN